MIKALQFIFVIAGLVIIGEFFLRVAIYLEKKEFNNGYCRSCGHKLTFMRKEYSGDRLYKCAHCGREVWVFYHKVDKNFKT